MTAFALRVAAAVLGVMLIVWHVWALRSDELSREFQLGLLALVTAALGWYASYRSSIAIRDAERKSRVRDCQEALRAEIIAFRDHQSRRFGSIRDALDTIDASFATETPESPFVPFVPSQKHNEVFEALVGDIQILPTRTIGPVVAYYQQVRSIELMAENMRSESYARLASDRRKAVLRDYLGLIEHGFRLADEAVCAIDRSIAEGTQ